MARGLSFVLRRRVEFRVLPFTAGYLLVAWAAAFLVTRPETGAESLLLFHVPDLSADVRRGLAALFTAPWLNAGPLQLVYVTVLLLVFGAPVESREGTLRAGAVFFGTSAIAAVVAGTLLHIIYPAFLDTPTLASAWTRAWVGGSAGCFGLIGATAARSQRLGTFLGLAVLWEMNVWYWRLQNYTPMFHFAALATGFLIARYLFRETRAGEDGQDPDSGGRPAPATA